MRMAMAATDCCEICAGTGVIRTCNWIASPQEFVFTCPACRGSRHRPITQYHRFANRDVAIKSFHIHHVFEAAEDIHNEDWKTALAHKQKPIATGARGVGVLIFNFYGKFVRIDFEGYDYGVYAPLSSLNYIETLML